MLKLNNAHIVKDTDPRLRNKSEPVRLPLSTDDREILEAMLTYVRNSTDPELAEKDDLSPAVGLAAPQIGVFKRMLVVVVDEEIDEDRYVTREFALVNPKIISHSEQRCMLSNGEACLSVDERHEGYVPRFARLKIKAYDLLSDKEVEFRVSGYTGIVLQHEIDHLNGVLYYDHINANDPWTKNEKDIVIE
jgi:peptide deformylase